MHKLFVFFLAKIFLSGICLYFASKNGFYFFVALFRRVVNHKYVFDYFNFWVFWVNFKIWGSFFILEGVMYGEIIRTTRKTNEVVLPDFLTNKILLFMQMWHHLVIFIFYSLL